MFGKIRYMNFAGCKRKFNVDAYVARVDALVARIKAEQRTAAAAAKK